MATSVVTWLIRIVRKILKKKLRVRMNFTTAQFVAKLMAVGN